jgi:hypothetical protein
MVYTVLLTFSISSVAHACFCVYLWWRLHRQPLMIEYQHAQALPIASAPHLFNTADDFDTAKTQCATTF